MNEIRVEVDTGGDGGNGVLRALAINGGEGGGREEVGEGGGGADRSNTVKAVLGAMMETASVGFATYPIAKSLHGALSVAYAALFLTLLLFLVILLGLLLRSGSGGGGCGAVKFAKGAAVAVVFLVPLLALAAKAYAVLNSK